MVLSKQYLSTARELFDALVAGQRIAAEDCGMDTREILVELGRSRMVGGQEDMIVDVALDPKKAKEG